MSTVKYYKSGQKKFIAIFFFIKGDKKERTVDLTDTSSVIYWLNEAQTPLATK